MEWTPGGISSDIEDRRGGGGFRMGGIGGPHIGIGGALLLIVLSLVFHRNFFSYVTGDASAPTADVGQPLSTASPDQQREDQFISFVLDDVQRTWDVLLSRQSGTQYHHAKLVLFQDYTDSGCGTAQSATGPFYCPTDEKVYIDLGFFNELSQRFGAPGEFAQAYGH